MGARLLRHTLIRLLAWLLAAGPLFAPLQIMAQACPYSNLTATSVARPQGLIEAAREGMDQNACIAHCLQYAQLSKSQSVSGLATDIPPPAVPAHSFVAVVFPYRSQTLGDSSPTLTRATAPPLAIQFCSFQK